MRLDSDVSVTGDWDILEVQNPHDPKILEQQVLDILLLTPGISLLMPVRKLPFMDLEQEAKGVLVITQKELSGRTFAVRCRRQAGHLFTTIDAERQIGAFLMRGSRAASVNLDKQFSYLLCCEKGMISRLHASHL